MTRASGVGAKLKLSKIPILPEVRDLALEGCIPGGTRKNFQFLTEQGAVTWDPAIDETNRIILSDAQTSGGLLIVLPKDRTPRLLQLLREKNTHAAAVIGEIRKDPEGRITVEP
jgi:selenide,water dikinase